MPALLPGSVLRIMVSNVGTGWSPLIDISFDPFSVSITGASTQSGTTACTAGAKTCVGAVAKTIEICDVSWIDRETSDPIWIEWLLDGYPAVRRLVAGQEQPTIRVGAEFLRDFEPVRHRIEPDHEHALDIAGAGVHTINLLAPSLQVWVVEFVLGRLIRRRDLVDLGADVVELGPDLLIGHRLEFGLETVDLIDEWLDPFEFAVVGVDEAGEQAHGRPV